MCLIRLNDLIINKNLSTLTIDNREISIEPKLLELLILFCDNAEHIISREQILAAIWPNSIVTDNAVNKLVASLRKLLNDDPKAPSYIQTVPKRGYRLIASVTSVEQAASVEAQSDSSPITPRQAHDMTDSPAKHIAKSSTIKLSLLPVLLLIVIVGAIFIIDWPLRTQPQNNNRAISEKITTQALTRMSGLERSPLMSQDQSFLLFLRENSQNGHRSLWHKSLVNQKETLIDGISPYTSRLIALDSQQAKHKLIYLAQENAQCHVSSLEIVQASILTKQQLFDCTGMRIFDAAWSADNHTLYYTAQAKNAFITRVYQFNTQTKQHSLITQPDASGMGNQGIDLAPDHKKLLIVHLDKNAHSQLYALDLKTNELTEGFSVPYSIKKAIWTQDSEHIMFYKPAPSSQIMISKLNGTMQTSLLSSAENLETDLIRIADSQDILFSTANLDFNNRWLTRARDVQEISNSTVYDMKPTLAHTSYHYAFVSTRSGNEQLYYGDLTTGSSRALSQLTEYRRYHHLAFSPNDNLLLAGDASHVWLLDVNQQLHQQQLAALTSENAIFTTKGALLSASWLSDNFLYFKIALNGQIKGYIYDLGIKHLVEVDNRWQVLITDHKTPNTLYMIDAIDAQLYQMPINYLIFDNNQDSIKFPEAMLSATGTTITKPYIEIKLYDGKIYYMTSANSGNTVPYDFQIEVKPIISDNAGKVDVFKTSCSCGYDIADSGFMLSEQVNIEGDIYRTFSSK